MSNSNNIKDKNKTQASLVKSDDAEKVKFMKNYIFKLMMNNKIMATEFLEEYLPEDVKPLVDLSTINIEKESYLDESLKKSCSDVLISVKMKNDKRDDMLIYCIAEHQNEPDYWMSLHLFESMIQICMKHADGKKRGKLPLIVPIVFYTGTGEYNVPRNIFDLFANPEISKEMLQEITMVQM